MEEWLSYRLSDFLLFSPRTYYRLLELYNRAVWPGQLVAVAAGLAIAGLAWRGTEAAGRVIAGILAAAWLWVAWAYHHERYATINWAASYYALAFGAQALLLGWAAMARGGLVFRIGDGTRGWAGAGLAAFAFLAQPLLGPLLGRAWLEVELFALAPDPTVVGTLGLLLMVPDRVPWALLPIPLLWCLVTGLTLWAMGAPDAVVPAAAALATVALASWPRLHDREQQQRQRQER